MRAPILLVPLLAAGCGELLGLDTYGNRDPSATSAASGGAPSSASSAATGGSAGAGGDAGGAGGNTPPPGCDGALCVFASATAVTPGVEFASVNDANGLCATWAAQASLPGGTEWRAWLSDMATTALDNLGTSNGPWKRRDGVMVAESKVDLTTALVNAIQRDEYGRPVDGEAWTGTQPDGSAGMTCADWYPPVNVAALGTYGDTEETSSEWTNLGSEDCLVAHRLYCFQLDRP